MASAKTAIPMPSESPLNFVSELSSALQENSFGLKEYHVTQETQLESIATVVLLEGHTITVSLSPRGFEVGSFHPLPLFGTDVCSQSAKPDIGWGDRGRSRNSRTAVEFRECCFSPC